MDMQRQLGLPSQKPPPRRAAAAADLSAEWRRIECLCELLGQRAGKRGLARALGPQQRDDEGGLPRHHAPRPASRLQRSQPQADNAAYTA